MFWVSCVYTQKCGVIVWMAREEIALIEVDLIFICNLSNIKALVYESL